MAKGIIRSRKLRQGGNLVLAGIMLGLIYVVFSDGFTQIYPFINGAIAGMLAGSAVAILELELFASGLRKNKFVVILAIRTAVYFLLLTFLILNVLIVSRMIRLGQSYGEVLTDPAFQHYVFKEDFPIVVIYTVALAFIINFTRMISRKAGQGMLLNYIMGTYRKPFAHERIVMFMKLKNSQWISEQLGASTFYTFLNDFFYDITESILAHGGTIYEYVEDLIVVTWPINKGLINADCIRTFYDALDELELKKDVYYASYQIVPAPYAAIHCGRLIQAEIGDVKTEIVFQGDVMNTTARILDKCEELEADLLVSSQLVDQLDLPAIYECQHQGELPLKGKEEKVGVNEISESAPASFQ